MASGGSQTVATFTGTLLRRERAGSQRLIQLVFREAGKNWLCVSTDPKTAKLAVGQDYRIEGVFKQHGDRPFIYEPSIALVKARRRALKLGLVGGGVVLLLAGTVGAVELPQHHEAVAPATSHAAATADAPAVTEPASQPVTTPPPSDQATTTPAPTAATTPAAPASVKKKTAVAAPVSTQKATVPATPSASTNTPSTPTSSQAAAAPATTPSATSTSDASATPTNAGTPAATDPGTADSTPSS